MNNIFTLIPADLVISLIMSFVITGIAFLCKRSYEKQEREFYEWKIKNGWIYIQK